MPSQLTYPGVYIEELSSGVRTITGVATSITLLIGWAPQGPVNRALRIKSFADFERKYGGLYPDERAYLGYAVRQFFDNGGSDAYIARIDSPDAKTGDPLVFGGLRLSPASSGDWCNFYGVRLNIRTTTAGEKRFQLFVERFAPDASGRPDKTNRQVVEQFDNLSLNPADYRFASEVINEESELIVAQVPPGGALPGGNSSDPKLFENGKSGAVLGPDDDAFATTALKLPSAVLDQVDLFNLLCVPGSSRTDVLQGFQAYCRQRRAFLIADCAATATANSNQINGLTGDNSINAAYYFPWLRAPDPLSQNRLSSFPPSGFVAGVYARTDAARGVWKAPAGIDASLTGVAGPVTPLTDQENGVLNPKGINCIRSFPVYNTICWGARTLRGDDELGSEWKYVPVRRTALFIEETLFRALKWVVFEPNDEPLWSQIRLNVGAFLNDLFRQGAFQGRSPRDAYFVKCDAQTTTQSDINRGIVNIVVGFAPLKPAEFVVVKITQIAGQIET